MKVIKKRKEVNNMTMKPKPKWASKPFKTESKVYPTITVALWNTTLKKAIESLKSGHPQRLQVGWPEMGTMLEFMLVPLNNKWDELRMTGTDASYTFVGIVGFGCYAFNLKHDLHPNYIKEELGLNEPEAIATSLLFKILGKEIGA